MLRTLLSGVIVAVFGALTITVGSWLGLELDHVALLGVALGAALGLVPTKSPWWKILGFLAGLLIAWGVYGLRAGWLPDTSPGRAVAVLIVVGACIAVVMASVHRIPLWSTLLGVAAMVGAYEEIYTNAPSQFPHESPTSLTTVLLTAAIGHLAASIFGPETDAPLHWPSGPRHRERRPEVDEGPDHGLDVFTPKQESAQ